MAVFASAFSCGGGADLGALAAGMSLDWALEREAWKVAVFNDNLGGDHCIAADVRRVDWLCYRTPFWWHTSPPCTTASKANPNAGETLLDLALAGAISRGIRALRPRRFSLENVWDYTSYFSFERIVATLRAEGYAVDWWLLDAADFGVPQNRKRLILVASLDHQPRRPVATHSKHAAPADQLGMFNERVLPWRGWFDAVKHRIHEFTDSEWANWQIPRLPKEWHTAEQSFLVGGGNTNTAEAAPGRGVRYQDQPAPTITQSDRRNIRAFVMHGGNMNGSGERFRWEGDPIFTVTASIDRTPFRAFIMSQGQGTPVFDHEPSDTVTGNHNQASRRAYLVSGADATVRADEQPSFTICASSSAYGTTRARLAGRVVQLSIGALADLQDFPPWYRLPTTKTQACDIIGNAVPRSLIAAAIRANR